MLHILYQFSVPIGVVTELYGAGATTQPILLRNVNCSGDEDNITECSHSVINFVRNCVHADDVGVICQGIGMEEGYKQSLV